MRTALLSLACFLAWSPVGHAQTEEASSRSMVEIVPADAWGFVEFAGLASCRQAAERTGLFRLAKDLWTRGLAARLERRTGLSAVDVATALQAGLRDAGFDPAAVRSLLQGPVVLAFGRPTMTSGRVSPSMLLAFDVRGREAAAASVVEAAQVAARRLGLRRMSASRVVLGVPVTTWSGGRGAAGRVFQAISQAKFDGRLVLSNSFGFLGDCVRTWRGERPGMAADRGLGQALQRVRGRPLVSLWVNLRPFAAALRPFLPYEAHALGAQLGVLDVDGLLLAAGVEGRGAQDVFHLGVKGSAEGLLRQAMGLAASHRAAKACPPETLVYFTMALDPRGTLEAAERLWRTLPVRDELAHAFREETGRDLEEILAEARSLTRGIGKEVTLAVPMPAAIGVQPSFLLLVDVADAEAVRDSLDSLPGLAGWKRARFGDREIRYADKPLAVGREGAPFLRPAYSVASEFLVIGTDVLTVKAALRRLDDAAPSLAAADDFRNCRQRFPEASWLGLVRLRAFVRDIWPTMRRILAAAVQQEDVLFDPAMLPESDELEQRLADYVAASFADDQGLTSIAQDPVGLGVLAALAGWAFDRLLVMPPREQAHSDGARAKDY